ncbi:hypothetical protein, partial [Roseixanthobacter glucoisosaccharinicivorans]|uniref:hypothetical protein n=1 Tax=Roseixanthobacter glucoisosaccharinicivorans TaxID=3119923 RepID=UPI00372BE07B
MDLEADLKAFDDWAKSNLDQGFDRATAFSIWRTRAARTFQWRFREVGQDLGKWSSWSDGFAPRLRPSEYEVEERAVWIQWDP